MSVARTARRRRKQMSMNNAHLSGRRVPRQFGAYSRTFKFSGGSRTKSGSKK